jgi:hypothetical protein
MEDAVADQSADTGNATAPLNELAGNVNDGIMNFDLPFVVPSSPGSTSRTAVDSLGAGLTIGE